MVNHIIFGADSRFQIHFKRLVYINKLNPICFAERDKNAIAGRGHFGLPVLSLKDALLMYPQAKFYIASNYPEKSVAQQFLLVNGVKRDDIINYEPFEYCHGCFWTRTFFTIYSHNILPCSEESFFKYSIKCSLDSSQNNARYFSFVEDLARDMSAYGDIPQSCRACRYYVKQFHPREIKIHQIGYGIGHACNSNCIYCATKVSERGERSSESVRKWHDEFSFAQFLSELKKTKYYDAKLTQVFLGPRELAVHKNRDEILQTAIMDETQFIIASNSILFVKDIATLAAKPQNYLFTSLDAGTRETFKTVKQVDKFGQTVDNIMRYKASASNVYLKYIVLPTNANEEDLTGFLDIVKTVRPMGVDIAIDAFMPAQSISENMSIFASKLATGLDEFGIPYLRYF
jgi:wyosine [tRNA(Phe)-imidazoG37] synthetase (radical SAM superfamily)